MGALRRFFAGPFDEIRTDPALRAYGIALAAVQAIVAIWWLLGDRAANILGPDHDPLCWPGWVQCLPWRDGIAAHLDALLYSLLAASLLAAALFIRRHTVPIACLLLIALKAIELAVMFADYRFRANQHYMALGALIAFIALPGRRDAVQCVIVAFYFGAGLLKLDAEWISGAALYAPLWFFDTPALITAACIYVIVLELGVIWALLSRHHIAFWLAFAQLVIFHVFSWPIVGFFYPMLMFGLIAIFPLCHLMPVSTTEPTPPSLLRRFWTGRAAPAAYAAIAVFAALQFVPVIIPGDEAITGEGRLAALHMFDARVECQSYVMVHRGRRTPRQVSLNGRLSHRIGCDPWVILTRARAVCDTIDSQEAEPPRVDLRHFAGRATEPMRTVVRIDDLCGQRVPYAPFARNAWIELHGEPWPPSVP